MRVMVRVRVMVRARLRVPGQRAGVPRGRGRPSHRVPSVPRLPTTISCVDELLPRRLLDGQTQ